MTQVVNLANFSNSLDSSGGLSTSALNAPFPINKGGTNATNANDARTNLGIGSIATQNSNSVNITGGYLTGITDLAIADGGTGASSAAAARTNLGVAINSDVLGYVAPGSSGNVLRSNGSAWTSSSLSSIIGINIGAGTVRPNFGFNAIPGPTGKILVQLSAHVRATYGNFGARQFGLHNYVFAHLTSAYLQTMEWDGRTSGDGRTLSYLDSGLTPNTTYQYYFWVPEVGPGVIDNAFYSWIGI